MPKTVKRSKLKLLRELIFETERKPLNLIMTELINLALIHRELPAHYFSNYLFMKSASGIENYLPIKRARNIVPNLNDQRLKEVLDNKLYFSLYYGQFDVSIPRNLMYNHGPNFCRGKELFLVQNEDEFVYRIKETFERNPEYSSIIAKKIYASSKGADIYKFRNVDVKGNAGSVRQAYSNIIQSEFIFQETIKQHAVLDLLNPSSVNTLRLDTLRTSDGRIDVLSGYIRMSLKNNHVDNISSGGCMVGVDLETGLLLKYGYPDVNHCGLAVFTYHPLTGTVFEGFQLPFIKEAKMLVTRAADLMPGLRIIGWDVAISETGPVIVEGNSDYGIRGNDLAYGGYLAHPVLKEVLKEAKL